jgi:hypothetical protein
MMKNKYYFRIQILLIIFGISLFFTSKTNAQLEDWRFECPVTISNNSGSHLVNYQILIKLNTKVLVQAGFMKPDGGDIRFAYNCGYNLIDYFLENFMNTDSTRIWIKINSLAPHSSVIIFLFMGNPSAVSASTLSIFEGPHSSTNYLSLQLTNTVPYSQRGFRFSSNRNILVTHFGKRIPNQTNRYVTLFDFNTHAIISQIQVDAGSPGAYNYNRLSRPLWLPGGRQYVLQLFQGAGDKYYFGVSTQIGPYLTYYDMRYCNNCTQNTFPSNSFPNLHYGTPDFLYYSRQTPVNPEPSCTAGPVADTNTPAPPQNLTVVAGNGQAFLTWRKNTEFDIDKYYIFMSTNNDPYSASQIGATDHPETTFTATGLNNGTTYYFWVKAVDRFCIPRISGFSNVAIITPLSVSNHEEIPEVFELYQNYPNPFNPATEIRYDIPQKSYVKLAIYDLLGQEVDVIINETREAGRYSVKWSPNDLPSGVYIYQLTSGDFEKTMKMVLLK